MVAKASSHTACPVSWGTGPAYKLTKYTRNACTMGVNVRPNRPPIDYLMPFSDSRKMPSSRVTGLKGIESWRTLGVTAQRPNWQRDRDGTRVIRKGIETVN